MAKSKKANLVMNIYVEIADETIVVKDNKGIKLMTLDNPNNGLYIYFQAMIEQYGTTF